MMAGHTVVANGLGLEPGCDVTIVVANGLTWAGCWTFVAKGLAPGWNPGCEVVWGFTLVAKGLAVGWKG